MARTSRETRTIRPAARRRPAKPVAERPASRRRRPAGETPYHHGDLHDALLAAAERVLERDGLPGLTLRAVAREAGVSHAAPTHHFGDLTGLLSELAAIGFRRFNAAMIAARNSETHPLMKGMANAKAYVAYAQAHPGMYGLMFRTERLDMTRPSLHEAATASFEGLASAVGAGRNEKLTGEAALSLDQAAAIARAWSLVHGFTTLLLDGRLQDILHRLPEGTGVDQLLERCCARPSRGRRGAARDARLGVASRVCAIGGSSDLTLRLRLMPTSATPANLGLPRESCVGFRVFVGPPRPVVILRLGVRPRRGAIQRAEDDLAIARRSFALPAVFPRPARHSPSAVRPTRPRRSARLPSVSSSSRCRRRSSRRGRCRRRAEP